MAAQAGMHASGTLVGHQNDSSGDLFAPNLQIDDAMQRFLSRGGSIKKIDQIAGEPVMGKDYLLSEEMLELVETEESDFF